MRKLLMAGAAIVLMAGLGVTAAAAGPNLFVSGTAKPGIARQHHMNCLQGHVSGSSCTTAVNIDRFACLPVTYGAHHTEAEECNWTGTQGGSTVYTDGAVNCHISEGYCMSWSDGDGDGVCDLCRNPAYRESSAASGVSEVNCHISEGYCMNWSDGDGDGVCDLCRNPAYCESSAASGVSEVNCHVSEGYCMSWSDGDGDGVCDLCRNPAYRESSAVSEADPEESQGQNYGGYASGCYGVGDNGCGNGGQGHHGSGHCGSGHHR